MNAYEVIIYFSRNISTVSLIIPVMKSYAACPFEKYQLPKLAASVDPPIPIFI